MNNLFLQELSLTDISEIVGGPMGNVYQGFIEAFIGILIVFILIFLALYVYLSIVYSKIGAKTKLSNSGIAWLPYGGWVAVIFESSKMHWWPFLMLVVGISIGYILMVLSFIMGATMITLASVILFVTIAIFLIMNIVWHWKTYEAVRKPGWWILVPVIMGIIAYALIFFAGDTKSTTMVILGMIVGVIGIIVHLVLISIAAFSKSKGKISSEYF